jgi:hypothetical protein
VSSQQGFRRADPSRPIATASVHYNDAAGIRAMAGAVQPRRMRPVLPDGIDNVSLSSCAINPAASCQG